MTDPLDAPNHAADADEHAANEHNAEDEPIEITDLDELRALVKARLVPLADAERSPIPTVRREVLPGVAAVLVLDLPDRIVPLVPERAAALAEGVGWEPIDDEHDPSTNDAAAGDEHAERPRADPLEGLWQLAYEQVRESDHPDIDVEEPVDGVPIMVLTSPSYFGATHALWPGRFMDAPPDGILVAAPHRHLVLVHGLRDAGVQLALPNLVLLARHHHDNSDSPISPWLYWLHHDTFHRIEVSTNDEGTELAIGIPEELQAALARLG